MAALRLQNITISGLQQWSTEATTSCSLASPPGGYNRGNNLFLSLSILCIQLRSELYRNNNNDTTNSTLYTIQFALGRIYTNMNFKLFTNIALVGSLEHIYIYVPSIRGEVLTGSATSSSSHFPYGGTCFLTLLTSAMSTNIIQMMYL